MKKIFLALALTCAVPLVAACETITNPSQVVDQTKVDEQLAVGANLAYKGWRLAIETGVTSGQIKGPLAAKLALIDNQLFEGLKLVNAAYEAGNSQSLAAAVTNFNTLLAQGNFLASGEKFDRNDRR